MARLPAVYLISLGCPKNLVDSEVICGSLATHGFALTDSPRDADAILINTCGFIEAAREEARAEIQRALRWKRKRRGRRVVVAGCWAQRNAAELAKRFPQVDLFLGLDDVPRAGEKLRDSLRTSRGGRASLPASDSSPAFLYDHAAPRLLLTGGPYAYVKIADGCDHFCRYCSIPRIRGRQRSRDPESVVEECRQLLDMGVAELNLVAQDTTRYGADLPETPTLVSLLDRLDQLDGDFWIRLLYAHPAHVTEELVQRFASATHLVPYLDLPLQHIATPVLRAMGRGMDGPATRELIRGIRTSVPKLALRTTLMVGFPGETEAGFSELLEFVEETRFERLGVFVFCPEPDTPAAEISDGLVPADVAEARRDILMQTQQQIAESANRTVAGTRVRVLVEEETAPRQYAGRTPADAPEIDNRVCFRDAHPGEGSSTPFRTVEITRTGPYDLEGVAVAP